MKEIKVRISYDTKDAEKSAENLKDKIDETKKASKSFQDQVDKLTGGAVSGFKSMRDGIKTAVTGFGALKTAVAATGLGLLLITVTAIVEYFKNTRDGANLIQQAFAALGGVTGQLGEAFKSILDLDFTRFLKAFGDIPEAVNNSVKSVKELKKTQDELFAFNQKFIKRQEELNQTIREQDFILKDTSSTFDERRAASKKLADADIELIELQAERIRLQKEQLELANVSENNEDKRRENTLAILQLEAELTKVETDKNVRSLDAAKSLREINLAEQALSKINFDEKKRLADEAQKLKDAEVEAEKKKNEDIAKLEFDRINKIIAQQELEDSIRLQIMAEGQEKEILQKQDFYDKLYQQAEGNAELQKQIAEAQAIAINEIEKKYQDQALANEQAVENQKVAIKKATFQAELHLANLTAGIAADLSVLMGKQGENNKALAIASILLSQGTALANSLANATAPTPDNIASGGLAALIKYGTIAAGITSTIAQIRNTIKGAQIPTITPIAGSIGGGQSIQGGAPRPLSVNDIANQFNQDALRAYVLVSDVNNGQDANNKLNNLATI